MKKFFIILAVLAVSGAAHGQISNPDVVYVTVAPSGACASAPPIQVVISTGTAYTCNNGTWAAAGGSGNATTVNGASVPASQPCVGTNGSSQLVAGTCTGGGGGIVVACVGTNDTAAINAALINGGDITLTGACLMGAASGHLTIKGATNFHGSGLASITYSPGSIDNLLVNAAGTASATLTFADVVTTSGSTTITSPSSSFTNAITKYPIECDAAYGSGGTIAGAAITTTTLFTFISKVTNGTTLVLDDAPSVSLNPTTCRVFTPDNNIRISGITFFMGGPSASTAMSTIKMRRTSNLTLDNLQMYDGATTAPSTSGGKEINIAESTNFQVLHTKLHSVAILQDGIDLIGPCDNGYINDTTGYTGDDFTVILAVSQGLTSDYPDGLQGACHNILNDGIRGVSLYGERAMGMNSAGGTPMPITNITLRNVVGDTTYYTGSGLYGGFGQCLAWSNGTFDNIVLDGCQGSLIIGAAWDENTITGSFTMKNISQTSQTFNGNNYMFYFQSVPSWGVTPMIGTLTVDGVKSNNYNFGSVVKMDQGTSITTAVINDVQLGNMTGGAFTPFTLNGSFGDITLSNSKFAYNSSSTSTGLVKFCGAATGASTVGKVSMNGVHVTHGAGSGDIGPLINITSCAGFATAVTDAEQSDVSDTSAATQTTDSLLSVSGGTLANYNGNNLRATNLGNCFVGFNSLTANTNIAGIVSAGITNPNTCLPSWNYSNRAGTGGAVAATTVTNSTANNSNTTVFTNSFSGPVNVLVTCGWGAGSVTGTATAALYIHTASLFPIAPALTLGTNSWNTFSQVFTVASSATVVVGVTYVANAGGNYSYVCQPTLQ